MKSRLDYTVSVAPMMDYTDCHYRYLARMLSSNALLYTEMITAEALLQGDAPRLLRFNQEEHPVAIQLGGSDPVKLAKAAKMAEGAGYDEINLNVGCPSNRVQAGRFGACLMKEPELVAQCLEAMEKVVSVPITVKTRLGVDNQESYLALCEFIETVRSAPCTTFILHARKAWLNGLSPKENRTIPPLRYEWVYRIKRDFPDLAIVLNGGVKTVSDVFTHLKHCDAVMIGRAAYSNPMLLAEIEKAMGRNSLSVSKVVEAYLPYIQQQLANGERITPLLRPLLGLYQGKPGARRWRQSLSDHGALVEGREGVRLVERALSSVAESA